MSSCHRFRNRDGQHLNLKKAWLRLLVSLRLDPARMQLILGFIDSDFRLNVTNDLRSQQNNRLYYCDRSFTLSQDAIDVSRGTLHQKLNGVETEVSAALVRETASKLAVLIEQMGGQQPSLLEGCQVRILDGNALAKLTDS